MKRKKDDYKRVKSKCEKTKKDVETGLSHGENNKADLRGNMLLGRGGILVPTDDAADLLKTEHFCILSQVNENNGILQKDVSSVSMCMTCSNGAGTM
eukprot:14406607-Ditylum_brightwellii.AAC.1